jgi:hypothetical protein
MTIEADVRAAAAQFGLDPRLLQAVVNAEGNIVKAVQCSIPSVTTREKALDVTCRSAVHAMSDFLHERGLQAAFVEFWQKRWAPNGAANDPTQLNANWSTNVKKLWGVVALLLLCAAPAFAQVDVVAKYRAQYATPLTAEQKVTLLRQIASEVHGGLLVKRDGNNCGGYSCDIVCFSDVTLFDVLQDSDGAAIPRWDATTNPRGYRCELVSAQTPVPTPIPQPPPVPVPVLDLSPILTRIDALFSQNERIYADLTNQHHDQTATLKAAIDEPGWVSKVFANRYVQLALAGVGTYLMTAQVKK